ncbi:MAG: ATP-dependent metallopeptidase FtsH/Yme1/Tma family protein [Clostridiales bacterium]|jgi:cell division protease FtsH|nr:ATP-dependent metallopeptidase FtsH/Yme1/Tma family protein [Clostridiales bacterium]
MRKFGKKGIIIILAALAVAAGALAFFLTTDSAEAEFVAYSEFLEWVSAGRVERAVLGDAPEITFFVHNSESTFETTNPRNPALKEALLLAGIAVSEGATLRSGSISAILPVLLMIAMFALVFRAMNKAGGRGAMALNAVAADVAASGVNFADVAGNDEAKDMVTDVVDFIKNPAKYEEFGARMPRGIILHGPPGTGKTLMARAIAGEAGVPFYAVSGSDFVQMYVGVGAQRVRELFKKARESGRAVIFIDEIDAVGKTRASGGNAGGNDERDQTLNALLTEMSGFDAASGIIVIAATNRPDTLDEALLRPGRFDRQIEIGLPDLAGRRRILAVHAENKPLENDLDLNILAKQTVFFSGAMLENLLNEAAIYAAKQGKKAIGQKEVDAAYYTIVAGSEKKDRSGIKEQERRITAYHEGGHALATKLLLPANSVAKITIIPSTKGAGGFCLNLPPDKMYYTKSELQNQAMTLLAGRAAEEIVFGAENITTGASNDIQRVNALIRDFVTKYGMSNTLGLAITEGEEADAECRRQIAELYAKTRELLASHRCTLDGIAAALLERESLNEDELDALIAA